MLTLVFSAFSASERSNTVSASHCRKIGRDRRHSGGAIRPRLPKSCLLFFPLSVRIKKARDRFPHSHPNSRFLLKKINSPPTNFKVSWDWSCESTVIYRAVAYLDMYMASVGVPELGKYQVRKKEGQRKRELVEN